MRKRSKNSKIERNVRAKSIFWFLSAITLNVNLWQDVRTGELEVTREVADIQRPGKTLFLSDRFGSLDGFKLLDPNMKKLEPKFGPHIAFLDEILAVGDGAWSEKIGQLSNPELGQVAKKLGAALDAARHLRAEVVDLRAFVSPENLGTLQRWGSPDTKALSGINCIDERSD